ncbi:MAG: bifunctional diaminohydroxyphosphoribosylaminopyrimidine deaminase/5-amino-6-(5-phosphoribosylamino)uracil reductase RibD [archaeon]|nr:bifunctional diaminohydroxyphosphoribosylaminopyrimidine deaminase/5-amino-6-(5-phosphoribosylamino)uracil reductase RibD [archaeon]
MNHEKFMKKAILLAKKAKAAYPNPMVGAVIVKEGKVIAQAYHEKFGEKHAEAIAIEKCGEKARGSDLYVTLEPCRHHGKQPPCTNAIIKAGISRVFVASPDQNPNASGGAKILRKHGIKVKMGVCEKEANKELYFYITKSFFAKKPKITIKIAITKDGFSTYGNGKRKRISGKKAFKFTQKLRGEHDAVLTGIGTILKDDPRLDVRKGKKQPLRIVLDSHLKISPKARVFGKKGRTIIFCAKNASKKKEEELSQKAAVVKVKKSGSGVDLGEVFKKLGQMGIRSVLVEPGPVLASSLVHKRLFDKLILIISAKKIAKGKPALQKIGKTNVRLENAKKIGSDTILFLVKT